MNNGELSHYEMVNSFSLADERIFIHVYQSITHRPIIPMYPEAPFLFLKGYFAIIRFDWRNGEWCWDIYEGEKYGYFQDLHLHDLEPYYLDAYESAVRIYNDMVEKTRASYLANVKQAKSQVIEISAAIVCGLVVVLALVGLS